MKILAFTPTYNEAGNIRELINRLLALPLDLEVLVVDDKSPDGTGEIVAEICKNNPRVHLISREPPRGRGLAGRDGFIWFQEHPKYDVLIEMDADLSHDPKYIPALVTALKDADVAIGSRYVPGGSERGRGKDRQWTSRLANMYLRFVLRTKQRDCTSGFRAFTRKALSGIDFRSYYSVRPTIVTEVLLDLIKRKRKIVEVPIIFEDRRWGESKLSWQILIDSLWFPLMLRWKYCWDRNFRR